jgi:hypothetical protein
LRASAADVGSGGPIEYLPEIYSVVSEQDTRGTAEYGGILGFEKLAALYSCVGPQSRKSLEGSWDFRIIAVRVATYYPSVQNSSYVHLRTNGPAIDEVLCLLNIGLEEDHIRQMIRKLKSGKYRLYSRKADAKTGKRRNLGTFDTREAAEKHERAVQYFKRRG